MRGWTFPIGTFFGVTLRIHSFFLLLCAFCISYAAYLNLSGQRGMALWALFFIAVAVRETARVIAVAWFALDLRSILLLPTGGLYTFTPDSNARAHTPRVQRTLALVGPAANLLFGLLLIGVILTFAPAANLHSLRLISPRHLLRALVWTNLLLAAVHLLPAWPLDAGRIFRSEFPRPATPGAPTKVSVTSARVALYLSPVIALVLLAVGMLLVNLWMIVMGLTLLLAAQLEELASLASPNPIPGQPDHAAALQAADTVTMRDVMLTDFTVLSASATLEDAMFHAGHTLQDVYPVVRGGNLVGAVSRQNILDALETSGNSYVQGIMTRSFQTAAPTDTLVATLRRIMGTLAGQGAQLVPIVEGERILGIITPQNLQRSMTMLNHTRRLKQATDAARDRDREN